MGWGAQQWLRATKEVTYGVTPASPAAGTVQWFRLPSNNAFTMRMVPQRVVIRSADGGNRRRQQVSARKVVAGALSTLFYPTQSEYLIDAALTLTANDLASYTLDYFDTKQVMRYQGCKVQSLNLPGTSEGDWVPAQVAFVGSTRDTVDPFVQPADTVFPAEVPFEHYETSGALSVGGLVQASYKSLGISIKNTLAPTFDEGQYITSCYYCGRDVDLTFSKQYLTTAMRDAFEAQAALTVFASWVRANPGKTVKFDLKTVNYVSDLGDDLPIDGPTYQDITIQAFYDQAAATDCAFTVTDTP